jgi:hypothetical protein
MCAHQSPHLVQRLILTNEANPKTKSTSQVENTNKYITKTWGQRKFNVSLYGLL